MSSPVVSSTVDNGSGDDGDVHTDQVKSSERQPLPSLFQQNDRMSPTTENADGNFGQQEQQGMDAVAMPPDENLFRRPQMVQRQSSQKQSNLDPEDEIPSEHSKLSAQLSSFQKTKKNEQKVR